MDENEIEKSVALFLSGKDSGIMEIQLREQGDDLLEKFDVVCLSTRDKDRRVFYVRREFPHLQRPQGRPS